MLAKNARPSSPPNSLRHTYIILLKCALDGGIFFRLSRAVESKTVLLLSDRKDMMIFTSCQDKFTLVYFVRISV